MREPPSPQAAADARRALDRLAFGPAPGEVEEVAKRGARAWIAEQLARPLPPPVPSDDPGLESSDLGASMQEDPEAFREKAREIAIGLAARRVASAVEAGHPLYETMVDFWANHFSVFVRKGMEALFLPSYERDVLRPFALGRFADLLHATARHPAMLFYLDNWRSAAPQSTGASFFPSVEGPARRQRPQGLNENYARELLELHTLGVDGGYTQQDVENVARVFTGWTIDRPRRAPAFRFAPAWHDTNPKLVLGETIAGGQGVEEGEALLSRLAAHPSTADHLARKLARRFLADDPPRAAVERTARRFLTSQGDMRATLHALLLEGDELFDGPPRKVKSPFELVVSALRATGVRPQRPRAALVPLLKLGDVPYLAPTPAGYPDTAERWIDPGAALERTRFMLLLASARAPGLSAPSEAALAAPEALLATLSESTRGALATEGLLPAERLGLALASPEFQLR
ncbi:MAG TPA: DUF1800 domain-containing protein [Deltaproteobacteria bacterium]|jgi:uncharacterized protein (DUF1800 family)|nr:DUF1800 domain-containing protein [Deltaproteobacteria bacterium]